MARETKIGLVVAVTFLGLLGIVVASKMRRPETVVAEVKPEHDEHTPPGSSGYPEGNGGSPSKPAEPPAVMPTGGNTSPAIEPPPLVPAGPTGEPSKPADPVPGPFAKGGTSIPQIEPPEIAPMGGTKPPSIELPAISPPEGPKKLNTGGAMPVIESPGGAAPALTEPGGKPGNVLPPPIKPVKPETDVPPLPMPGVDLPKVDLPKTDLPKTDLPKVDLPKTDLPKSDLPKSDLPKSDLPKVEFPNNDLPKIDFPKNDPPKVEPKVDIKITQPSPLGPGGTEGAKPGGGEPPPLVPKTPINPTPIGTPMGDLLSTSPVTPGKLPSVTNHAEEITYTKPGESFDQLSQRLYGSPKYAGALLEYNRKHPLAKANILSNPPQLQANQAVYYPSKNILEIQYGSLIGQGGGSAVIPGVPTAGVPTVKITPLGGTGNPPTADPTVTMTLTQPRWVFDIARQTLGDGQRWVEILRLNPSLHTEQPIPAGTALRLPATAKLP